MTRLLLPALAILALLAALAAAPAAGQGLRPSVPATGMPDLAPPAARAPSSVAVDASARVADASDVADSSAAANSHAQACRARYRSYDAKTDRYTSLDGRSLTCTLPAAPTPSRPPVATTALGS